MAVVFKYKSPISQTYAPGKARPGSAGPEGIKGNSGNALYFIDFDLDNSYNISQALQKIENNKIISINNNDDLPFHEYKVNDILLSNTGKCYRITKNNENSLFSNYSFDIEYLGEMNKAKTSPVKFVVIYDFTNATFYKDGTMKLYGSTIKYAGDIIRQYNAEETSCYLTNRTEKPYTSKFSIDEKDYSLVGSWIKLVGYSLEDTTPTFDIKKKDINGSKHSFVIQLNNNKNISYNSVPFELNSDEDNNGYNLNFKKKLEFPNIKLFSDISLDNGEFVNNLLYEMLPDDTIKLKQEEYDDYTLNEVNSITNGISGLPAKDLRRYTSYVPKCTTSYISDYSLDDLHPSNNNIKCTINNDRKMWFKSGIKTEKNNKSKIDISKEYYKNYLTEELVSENPDGTNNIKTLSFKVKNDIIDSLSTYGGGLGFIPVNLSIKTEITDEDTNVIKYDIYSDKYEDKDKFDSSTSTLLTSAFFPKYSAGIFLSEYSEDDIQEEIESLYKFGINKNYYNVSSEEEGDNIQYSNILQFPTYPSYITDSSYFTNYKGGNSLYFSGIDNITDTYENIFDFITNNSNTFNIVTTFEKTKEMLITSIPILIDTSFKDSSVYIRFGQESKNVSIVSSMKIYKNGKQIATYTYR